MSTFTLEVRSLTLEVGAIYYPYESDRAQGWDIASVHVVDSEGDKWAICPDGKFTTEIYEALEVEADRLHAEDLWEAGDGYRRTA